MIVESDYRGHRIQVIALLAGTAWNATVRIRLTLSEEKPHVEVVTCRKPTADAAEKMGLVYARLWVDRRA